MKTKLQIERLVLRTRGLTPAAAEATARALGPALAEVLPTHLAAAGSVPHLQVTLPAGPAASPAQIARQIATQLSSAPRL